MTRHTYDTDIEIAGLSLSVEIAFDFEPGYDGDETDPAVQPMAEIVKVRTACLGLSEEFPDWLVNHLNASLDLHDELVGYAIEQSQPDPDAAYDAARDAATQAEKMHQRAAALLARADEVERKELARRGNLVLFGDIERALVSSTGLSAATIAWTNRMLRQGGLLEARARGRSAESITVSQAAIHVIALLAFEKGRTTAEATATLLGSETGKEVGVRPHDTLISQNTLGDIVTAILALLAEDDATIEFTVNRSDLSAMVTVEIAGQRWSAFFPPRRECAGDYRELAAFTDATFRALAALYTGERP